MVFELKFFFDILFNSKFKYEAETKMTPYLKNTLNCLTFSHVVSLSIIIMYHFSVVKSDLRRNILFCE